MPNIDYGSLGAIPQVRKDDGTWTRGEVKKCLVAVWFSGFDLRSYKNGVTINA